MKYSPIQTSKNKSGNNATERIRNTTNNGHEYTDTADVKRTTPTYTNIDEHERLQET